MCPVQKSIGEVCSPDICLAEVCAGEILSFKGLPSQVGAAEVTFSIGVAVEDFAGVHEGVGCGDYSL